MEQEERSFFLHSGMFTLLQILDENNTPAWGKMNSGQMVEHLTDFFNVSVEKIVFPLLTPEEHLPKYREFLYSDKQFRENTKAPTSVIGDEPLAMRTASLREAKQYLQKTVEEFFEFFKLREGCQTMHPAFGLLNFDEWIMLHYKHVTHHFRQFGLMNNN